MENIRWTFRPMTLDDIPMLLEWYNNQELHVTANAKPFRLCTLDELMEYWRGKLASPSSRYYAIVSEEQVVGRVGLKQGEQGEQGEQREHGELREQGEQGEQGEQKPGSIEFSILIGETRLHSRGLGTEITRSMLQHAFTELGAGIVWLTVRNDNKRAIRCYEKSGYQGVITYEEYGVLMHMMRISREEWAKVQ